MNFSYGCSYPVPIRDLSDSGLVGKQEVVHKLCNSGFVPQRMDCAQNLKKLRFAAPTSSRLRLPNKALLRESVYYGPKPPK